MTPQEIEKIAAAAERTELNIVLYKAKLPEGSKGVTAKDGEQFIIVINSNLSEPEQEKAFIHEMLHIWHNDFDNPMTATELEAYRRTENSL